MINNFIIEVGKIAFVRSIKEVSEKSYCFNYYLNIFKTEISVQNKNISLFVCVPPKWELDLVDIYIENYQLLKFIPHVESNGKICLFEKEGILIDKNLLGITIQSLYRAEKILKDGLLGKNSEDFINEFEIYWGNLPNRGAVEFVRPNCGKSQNVKCAFRRNPSLKTEKNTNFTNKIKKGIYYIAKNAFELERWKLKNSPILNAAYFVINASSYIFPPDYRNNVSADYLNGLLKLIDKKIGSKILSKLGREKVIIFQINQINNKVNYLGFFIKEGNIVEFGETLLLDQIEYIQPLVVRRADREYLLTRTACSNTDFKKKILVIGCGSIGGYLINELVKEGFSNLTIVDDDCLCNENIFRHLLGLEYVSQKKCFALKKYLTNNIPDIHIEAIDKKIEDILLFNEIDLKEFDLIFSATGNHNVNRWLNKYINENRILTPAIYLWNEVYGIGNHVAYFKYNYQGCYDCLFDRNEDNGELYDRSSYCKDGQKISLNVHGCDKSFIPYGNIVSLKTVTMCMDIVEEVLNNEIRENFILSAKGNDNYFKKQGLKVSKRYENQVEKYKRIIGKHLINTSCEVCYGNK